MEPWLKVSSYRLENPGIKHATPGKNRFKGECFIQYTIAAPEDNVFWYYLFSIMGNVEITSVKFGAISKLEPDTSIGSHTGR